MYGFLFLLAVVVPKSSASYRYGLMNGQIPLGELLITTSTSTPQECGKFCSEQGCPALVYYEAGACYCYSQITGYADAEALQSGYIEVDDTYTDCLTTAEHQAIVKNMVYAGAECPQGFNYESDDDVCCCDWSGSKCAEYSPWNVDWYDESDQYHCHVATSSNA